MKKKKNRRVAVPHSELLLIVSYDSSVICPWTQLNWQVSYLNEIIRQRDPGYFFFPVSSFLFPLMFLLFCFVSSLLLSFFSGVFFPLRAIDISQAESDNMD